MKLFTTALSVWRSHGTRILGIAQGSIAAIAGISDLIPAGHLKYWLAASALLTFWRGQVNSTNPPPAGG